MPLPLGRPCSCFFCICVRGYAWPAQAWGIAPPAAHPSGCPPTCLPAARLLTYLPAVCLPACPSSPLRICPPTCLPACPPACLLLSSPRFHPWIFILLSTCAGSSLAGCSLCAGKPGCTLQLVCGCCCWLCQLLCSDRGTHTPAHVSKAQLAVNPPSLPASPVDLPLAWCPPCLHPRLTYPWHGVVASAHALPFLPPHAVVRPSFSSVRAGGWVL